ncbi:MAG TPA: XrtA-associated tyrosine autokinase [Dissulfurispiraceae bacterium]|nr:XrtA-associated tyrosine autokinase [Dissulfurispiraceae bacterium]
MSRIEEALQKAMQMRKGESAAGVAEPFAARLPEYDPSGAQAVEITSPYIITNDSDRNVFAEEFRKLKTMIIRELSRHDNGNTVMVTSAGGGEGKSITAINLAIALAQEFDNTVLFIDADLRRPSLQQYLHIGERPGLTDCLVDGIDMGKVLIKTTIGKLTLLPSGRAVPNPTELLASQKMKVLFNEIKNRYSDRYVIIDAPPVLPVAETRNLASLVDGIVFVVAEGVVPERSVRDSLELLHDRRILGFVFSNVSPENLGPQHGYYYYTQGNAAREA